MRVLPWATLSPVPPRDLELRYAEGSARASVALTHQPGKSNDRANSSLSKTREQGHGTTPVIMDMLSNHKCGRIREMIEAAGAMLL